MPNPTASNYLQANLSYVWTDGDVYEIAQTDQQEGGPATGASFNGLGVDNQPHQILLNKIQYTHAKQLVDETNISILQAFMALFVCKMGVNGYIGLGAQDLSLGQVQPFIQWGTINLVGAGGPQELITQWKFTFNFPMAFPNAIYALAPYWQANTSHDQDPSATQSLAAAQSSWVLEAMTPLQKQTNSILVSPPQLRAPTIPPNPIEVALSPSDDGITGIGWIAIGY
ncbi:MAG: hypothetical protein JO189_21390 [Deltaproteobacteria bacterium]|nr:hypothetical protein [Deltaproteobacteria bacterium]